jgi:hypothetical protein
MEERMLDYNEFVKSMNCDKILRDLYITIEGKRFYRIEQKIEYLKPGESIGVRYNDNENEFEIRYIKTSDFSIDGREVYIKLFSQIELENKYRDYLYENFYTSEHSECGDITFYPTTGVDFHKVKKYGFSIYGSIELNVLSYEEFLENLKNRL